MLRKIKGAFLLISFAFAQLAFASNLPRDLRDLERKWTETTKEESYESYMGLSQEIYEKDPLLHDAMVFSREVEQLNLMDHTQIEKLSFKKLASTDVRKSILKKLFGKQGAKNAFCQSYPVVELKVDDDNSELSAEDREKQQKRFQANLCKRLTENMLGGIIYANPSVYVFESVLSFEDTTAQSLVIYVRSMIDQRQYLRYSFKLK